MNTFDYRKALVEAEYESLLRRPNVALEGNGVYERYKYPIVTSATIPPFWKYDYNRATNPCFMERIGINATLNSGAIKWNGKYVIVVRVEGNDRKSFFAVAESDNGIDGFRFWNHPITMPESDVPATNIYDMRLTRHEDGWITVSSAWSVMTTPNPTTSPQPLPHAASREPETLWNGSACRTSSQRASSAMSCSIRSS